jgi:hypothetical protein
MMSGFSGLSLDGAQLPPQVERFPRALNQIADRLRQV